MPYSYAKASSEYPSHVAMIVQQLHDSRSKYKLLHGPDLLWELSVAWHCGAPYLGAPDSAASLYLWELGRVEVFLTARAPGPRSWTGGLRIPVPSEVKDHLTVRCNKQVQDYIRHEALSDEEKQAEFEQALRFLRKSPGFMELSIRGPIHGLEKK